MSFSYKIFQNRCKYTEFFSHIRITPLYNACRFFGGYIFIIFHYVHLWWESIYAHKCRFLPRPEEGERSLITTPSKLELQAVVSSPTWVLGEWAPLHEHFALNCWAICGWERVLRHPQVSYGPQNMWGKRWEWFIKTDGFQLQKQSKRQKIKTKNCSSDSLTVCSRLAITAVSHSPFTTNKQMTAILYFLNDSPTIVLSSPVVSCLSYPQPRQALCKQFEFSSAPMFIIEHLGSLGSSEYFFLSST